MNSVETPSYQSNRHMLPESTHLGMVSLQVSQLERSLDYYQQVIGLRLLERTETTAILGSFGTSTPLLALHERQGINPVPRRGRLGLYHFAILLPNRAELGKFLKHLAEIGAYAGMSDHLFSEALYLTDPDGLGIEVYADRPRSSWQYKEGEIVGATIPLDTQSVIQAAGNESWHGMPQGTVIGHIHFYVNDLAKAEAFYHQGLGFDVVIRSYPGALFVSAGGYHHHIGLNTWAAGAAISGDDDARLLSWELSLGSQQAIDETVQRLRSAGFSPEQSAEGWQLKDPWGSLVRFTV
ncbi:MAG: VOC family protein [Trueperaceae bacterium]|nr:VOC family protein [Trueperaceae bacterium]